MNERMKLKEELENVKMKLVEFPDLVALTGYINAAIADIIEPEGPAVARSLLREIKWAMNDETVYDDIKKQFYNSQK